MSQRPPFGGVVGVEVGPREREGTKTRMWAEVPVFCFSFCGITSSRYVDTNIRIRATNITGTTRKAVRRALKRKRKNSKTKRKQERVDK
jgi:hypothetical protein